MMQKGIADLLLLGDPRLYAHCEAVRQEELPQLKSWVADLHQVMEDIRATYQFGRGIAAPQLGIMKRLIYINVDQPLVIINPEILSLSEQSFRLWDDCMSFPNLLVEVERHQQVHFRYRDEEWMEKELIWENDLSELFQHEFDHLNGILCTMRAIGPQSFRWKPTPKQ
ncbi:MAG: peptide deformylase [Bacteroidota bacterium]